MLMLAFCGLCLILKPDSEYCLWFLIAAFRSTLQNRKVDVNKSALVTFATIQVHNLNTQFPYLFLLLVSSFLFYSWFVFHAIHIYFCPLWFLCCHQQTAHHMSPFLGRALCRRGQSFSRMKAHSPSECVRKVGLFYWLGIKNLEWISCSLDLPAGTPLHSPQRVCFSFTLFFIFDFDAGTFLSAVMLWHVNDCKWVWLPDCAWHRMPHWATDQKGRAAHLPLFSSPSSLTPPGSPLS